MAMVQDGVFFKSVAAVHPRFRTPHVTTILTGVVVGGFAAVMSIDEMVDLTNIGTLFAFTLVCIGVVVLRHTDPDRRRPFRVPFVYVVAPVGALLCIFVMRGLPHLAWVRFGWWLLIGLALYVIYGYGAGRAAATHWSLTESGLQLNGCELSVARWSDDSSLRPDVSIAIQGKGQRLCHDAAE